MATLAMAAAVGFVLGALWKSKGPNFPSVLPIMIGALFWPAADDMPSAWGTRPGRTCLAPQQSDGKEPTPPAEMGCATFFPRATFSGCRES